jgi:hypothetical protein
MLKTRIDIVLKIRRVYSKYKLGPLEFEVGKDSLWLGHGVHGSLLLSNHAEPFPLAKLTTDQFRLPSFLRYLGEFKYMLFHGWLEDFNVLGHRFGWKPFSLLEFGFNQTPVYLHGKDYTIWDIPNIFFSSEENTGINPRFNNDQRASMDVALYLPFLNRLPLLEGGKVYAEYGGEDSIAWWQEEDEWVGPIGFEFLAQGIMLGGLFTTGSTDLRIEYSENYRNYPIFFNWYKEHGLDHATQGLAWYRNIPFLNNDVLMGHHMGPEADDLFISLKHRFTKFIVSAFYDRERHKFYEYANNFHVVGSTTSETRHQYGLNLTYHRKNFVIDGMINYITYSNVDTAPEALTINISEGQSAQELVTGVGIRYLW